MSKLQTLTDGLVEELKDLYSAEKQLVKALPKMEKKASNKNLKQAFAAHLKETKVHVDRLDEIGSILGEKLSGKTCKAMKGLIEEGSELLEEESENDALIDALLVGAAQRVEHYEMAAYGTARAMAKALGHDKVVKILQETLDEEGEADKKLTAIATKEILKEANTYEVEDSPRGKKSISSRVAKSIGMTLLISGISIISFSELRADQTSEQYRSRNAAFMTDTLNLTADEQSQNEGDLKVLAELRKEIIDNKNLSMEAHNITILVKNNIVTFKGSIRSEDEKNIILSIGNHVAPNKEIVNEMEIRK